MGNCWPLVASQEQQGRLRNVFTSACLSRGIPRAASDIVAGRGKVPEGAAWRCCCCSELMGPICGLCVFLIENDNFFALALFLK